MNDDTGIHGRLMCGVCHGLKNVDDTQYIFPDEQYAPGICESCKELPIAIQQAFYSIHLEVNPGYFAANQERIIEALTAYARPYRSDHDETT
jgi:hypothetical protein